MTISELAELFLFKLYERAEKQGFHASFNMNEIAEELGVSDDYGRIKGAVEVLENRGLVSFVKSFIGGKVIATISGEGCVLVETGGDTGIIQQYRNNPNAFIHIDQSTTIHGNVTQSNISTHSPNAQQSISVNKDIQEIIAQILERLRRDETLTATRRNDAILDTETLAKQLSKAEKNGSMITSVLSSLSDISSIGGFILQLQDVITKLF